MTADRTRGRLALKAESETPYEPIVDREAQIVEALADLSIDPASCPRFSWESLHAAAGPLLPGDLWVVSSRTGHGKTTFVLNWVNALASADEPTIVALFPLEVPPKDIVKRLACLRLQLDPALVFRNDWRQLWAGAEEAYIDEIENMGCRPFTETLLLRSEPRMTRGRFVKAVHECVEEGAKIVIVDHLLRMIHGTGENLYAEISETMRVAKELAKQHKIAIVMTSQQGRTRDGNRLAPYHPPDLSVLKGSGTIEEEADAVLFLFRPLKKGLTKAEHEAFQSGHKELREMLEPNAIAISIGKHRLDGEKAMGRQVVLHFQRGVITEMLHSEPRYEDEERRGMRS